MGLEQWTKFRTFRDLRLLRVFLFMRTTTIKLFNYFLSGLSRSKVQTYQKSQNRVCAQVWVSGCNTRACFRVYVMLYDLNIYRIHAQNPSFSVIEVHAQNSSFSVLEVQDDTKLSLHQNLFSRNVNLQNRVHQCNNNA